MIVIQPFHPARISLLRRNLGPLFGFLVASDALVGCAPADLNGDSRSCLPQRSDVLPCLERLLQAGARLFNEASEDAGFSTILLHCCYLLLP